MGSGIGVGVGAGGGVGVGVGVGGSGSWRVVQPANAAAATPTNPRYARLSITVKLVFSWRHRNIIMGLSPAIHAISLVILGVLRPPLASSDSVSSEFTM
ncbi:hypothetical protein Hfx1150_16485 [Haloferax sp. CBA1150]|nr:hypothetical protein Hfx1150_16485 [Haloferax sp. CBA1150]